MSNVVVFVRDFELGTRIADVVVAHGKEPVFPMDHGPIDQNLSEDTVLVILDLSDSKYHPLDLIRTIRENYPDLSIVGFLSQIQKRLLTEAREAGCTWVLPRSSFVQNLPTLLEKGGIEPE